MRMKMKRVFRRNQIIITTLAIMIAAAGYLNYAGKSDLPGADTYEAGATKISDSDIYSENQAVSGSVADGEYEEIASLDDPGQPRQRPRGAAKASGAEQFPILRICGDSQGDVVYAIVLSPEYKLIQINISSINDSRNAK